MSDITMMDYIRETPVTVLHNIENSKNLVGRLRDFYIEGGYENIVIVASGSSYNGCMCARTYMRKYLQCEVKIVTPFTFTSYEFQYLDNSLFMFVSQSGCSTNTIAAAKMIKEKGYKTVGIVGRDDCDLKEYTDLLINWGVGEEKIGFVTKGVVTLALFMMLFGLETSLKKNIISEDIYNIQTEELKKTMDIHPKMVDETIRKFELNKDIFIKKNNIYVLGTGPSFGVALEGALKIAETNCITAYPVETEEFLHGPMYATNPDTLVIVIDNNTNPSTKRSIDIANANRTVTDKTFVISNSKDYEDDKSFRSTEETSCHTSVLYKLACVETLAYLMTVNTNNFEPHENIKKFKKENAVASKSRNNLFMDLQKVNQ
ncbi:MAG: SIS domain-containing protein [Erysipelotrichaceae bacterium]|nr:SIS domain-containing protein [Erysipelotrichaceae bacterium]